MIQPHARGATVGGVPDSVVNVLLQNAGPLGAVLVISFWALNKIHKQLSDAQEKRISDAQANIAKVLELVASQHESTNRLAAAIDGNADANRELRMMLEAALADRGVNRLPTTQRRG